MYSLSQEINNYPVHKENISPEIQPENIVKKNSISCGEIAILFKEILRRLNLNSRIIKVFNPEGSALSHVFVEVNYGEKWHLYDPTYSIFYSLSENPLALPLSFSELRNTEDSQTYTHRGVTPGFLQQNLYFVKKLYPEKVLKDLKVELPVRNSFFTRASFIRNASSFQIEE